MKLFVAVPSYRGISEEQAKKNSDAVALAAAGHSAQFAVLNGHALIDQARAELVTVFRSGDADAILMQDDDVMIDGDSILDMLKCEQGVVSAPCRMRSDGFLFNVVPITEPEGANGVLLAHTLWTGLGCVLVRREIIEAMCVEFEALHYKSQILPGKRSIALFNSLLVPCSELEEGGSSEENDFLGDDRAFSVRLRSMAIPIWASLDARTIHRGIKGCMGDELRARGAISTPRRAGRILGPDGQPL